MQKKPQCGLINKSVLVLHYNIGTFIFIKATKSVKNELKASFADEILNHLSQLSLFSILPSASDLLQRVNKGYYMRREPQNNSFY